VRRLRLRPPFVQLVPRSALSQVSGTGPSSVGPGTHAARASDPTTFMSSSRCRRSCAHSPCATGASSSSYS
jgi:hypothetical protein